MTDGNPHIAEADTIATENECAGLVAETTREDGEPIDTLTAERRDDTADVHEQRRRGGGAAGG
jgi:hypothetical protein